MSAQPNPTDELRTAILKAGTVHKAKIVVSQKMYSNNTVSALKMSNQDIVEMGIDDLMQLVHAHTKTVADECVRDFVRWYNSSVTNPTITLEQYHEYCAAKWLPKEEQK